jgi:hypothetical protein
LRFLRPAVFALALAGASAAGAATQVELTPAWGGWSRPGRVTEIVVRAQADTATRGSVEIMSGVQSLHARLELAAGDTRRYEVTVPASAALESEIKIEGASAQRNPIALSLSESPLLGVALVDAPRAQLAGFHAIAVAADDLPRNAAAYSSVDAVALDGATIRALDSRQLVALIGHAAACGRLALVAPTPDVRRLLEGSAGCGARMLASGATAPEALDRLAMTLANPAASPASAADLSYLLQPEARAWPRLVAALAAFFGVAALALLLARSTPLLLLVPLLATVAMGLLLITGQARTRLVIWAEAAPAVRVAQYQAWQEVAGATRGNLDIALLAGLGHPQACDAQRPVQFEVDALRGRPVSARFEGRLFDTAAVCYSGHFPVMRAVRVTPQADGAIEVRNDGALAWPPGTFVSEGAVQPLPALEPGKAVTLLGDAGRPPQDAAQRAALARTPFGGYGVLWPLALGTVTDAPAASAAWLLVPIEGPT